MNPDMRMWRSPAFAVSIVVVGISHSAGNQQTGTDSRQRPDVRAPQVARSQFASYSYGIGVRIPRGLHYCRIPEDWVGSDHSVPTREARFFRGSRCERQRAPCHPTSSICVGSADVLRFCLQRVSVRSAVAQQSVRSVVLARRRTGSAHVSSECVLVRACAHFSRRPNSVCSRRQPVPS